MLKILSSRSDAHIFWRPASGQGHSLKLGTRFSAAFLALGLALSGCSSETITISESTVSASNTSSAEHSSASSQSAEASQQPTVSAQDSEQTPTVTEVGESPEENNADTSTAHQGSQVRPGTVTIVNPDTSSIKPQGTAPIGSDEASEALRILNTLPVKGRAPKTGYSRAQFGDAWSDIDHNGCDTRNDILNRDLTAKQHKNPRGCVVISGILNDPYTGKIINFMRGKDTSEQVQIDHVVALSDAWQSGAQEISAQERLQALEAERLILRNQVAEITDKYQLDPEAIEVGQTEVSVKSMEQQLEKLTPTEETAKEMQEVLKEAFPEQSFRVSVDYALEEPEWVAHERNETIVATQEVPEHAPEEPVFDAAYYDSLEVPEIELTEDDLSEFQQNDYNMQP